MKQSKPTSPSLSRSIPVCTLDRFTQVFQGGKNTSDSVADFAYRLSRLIILIEEGRNNESADLEWLADSQPREERNDLRLGEFHAMLNAHYAATVGAE